MKAVAMTDIGKKRKTNQDFVYTSMTPIGILPNLFIVADGMGGHKAGDTASRFTVETLVKLLKENLTKDAVSTVEKAILEVNTLLLEKAKESEDYTGMGTTLCLASIIDDTLLVANVGDSRLYVVDEDIRQVTRDHSLVEEMVLAGEINKEEARNHERKNVITRAIGGTTTVEPDMFRIDLKKNDRILLCSDGLTNMLEDTEIADIIKDESDINNAAKKLIDKANKNGGLDNISVVIIKTN
ncbi:MULTISPECIES: Stp1/IreP family PP2C-type Ser/Thr phosphatase [Lachnospira]|uniref:Protein phosphatase n=2 Tax=Lachnospira TaxID=28050 RepID=A0A1H5UWB0_9FIRM|nr:MULTISPECIES: Stp1/IreP family PP2C-type Ser/Thr phosphatase [Lachnospira]MBQ2472801.1 Stp1/IreP family PP2C-type Ser/Thr phosphatase [Lachnospira sp.]MCR5515850.1 Stp1/IreP family PP2C-type Ser/Thr phosphatase [Lachnospira sp.]SDN15399.1 protein phosphatase [Lachnospira pectinoschiza]SEF78741.1 protein phosphatase [Lachnospira multipara]